MESLNFLPSPRGIVSVCGVLVWFIVVVRAVVQMGVLRLAEVPNRVLLGHVGVG